MKPSLSRPFYPILLLCILILFLLPPPSHAQPNTNRQALDINDLSQWEEEIFDRSTEYKIISLDGIQVLRAKSHNSASGLFKKVHIDLNKTPFLNWSWRVKNVLTKLDERSKQGDDFAARIYIVVSGGLFFWNTQAINYVWSNNQVIGTHWPNPFTSNATMIAIQSGDSSIGQWRQEKRDIRADIQRFIGPDVTHIDAIAIMSDSDNSHQSTTAYFKSLYFSEQ